jgi:hypothetical protein
MKLSGSFEDFGTRAAEAPKHEFERPKVVEFEQIEWSTSKTGTDDACRSGCSLARARNTSLVSSSRIFMPTVPQKKKSYRELQGGEQL